MADELSKEEENTDWYAVLGLDVSSTEKDVNKAFKKMSLVWHPDKNGGSEEAHAKFMKIKEAKIFLLDGKKRKLYDEKRAAQRKTEALLVSFCVVLCGGRWGVGMTAGSTLWPDRLQCGLVPGSRRGTAVVL